MGGERCSSGSSESGHGPWRPRTWPRTGDSERLSETSSVISPCTGVGRWCHPGPREGALPEIFSGDPLRGSALSPFSSPKGPHSNPVVVV